jgi:hypothetical protein
MLMVSRPDVRNKEGNMTRTITLAFLLMSVAGLALASINIAVPEIDATSGAMAVSLLGGALLVVRARRKK